MSHSVSSRATVRFFGAIARLAAPAIGTRHVGELVGMYEAIDAEARRRGGTLAATRALARELPPLAHLVVRERFAARVARTREQRLADAELRRERPYSEDTSVIESFVQDVRYAVRALGRNASFATIAVASLALGIGANAAIFSVVNGVLLRPLPFPEAERLVTVLSRTGTDAPDVYAASPANFMDIRRGVRSATSVAAFSTQRVTATGTGDPESLQAVTTVGDIFGVLGGRAFLGRTLTLADDSPSSQEAVVLAHGAWQRLFGGDRAVIGRSMTINRRPRVIVGVMPPDFQFAPAPADVWIPERWTPEYAANRDQYYLQIIARIAPGRSVEQLSSELEAVAMRLRTDQAEYNTDLHLAATALQDTVVTGVRTRLLVLMAAVGFLLLITCANLANLTLARASTRVGEFAVRRALGASRGRIARQLITESLLLGLAGGVAGLGVGRLLLGAIIAAERDSLPRVEEIALDTTTLLFALAASLVAGLAVGVLPALRASGARAMEALRQGLRGSGMHQRARSTLVVLELAVALMLLAGAGLLVRSFQQLLRVDPGFRSAGLLTMQLNVGPRSLDQVEQSIERLRAIPGVTAAAVTSNLPVSGRGTGAWFNRMDHPLPANETPPSEAYRVVSPEYFRTMGIRLLRGRLPTADDRADRSPVVLVNESLARRYWPNEDPIGKEVRLGAPGNYLMPPSRIVGIVADTPDAGLDAPALPQVFLPQRVAPWWTAWTFIVRTDGRPEALTAAARRELRESFPTVAIRNVRTMDTVLSESVAPARVSMRLIGAFAIVALITAGLGVFGVLSFAVAQRSRELGIRMALGAAPNDVRWMVIAYGGRLALAGVTLGLIGAFPLTRFIGSMLFGVAPTDPLTFAVVTLVLLLIGVLASWLPARRATTIDPIVSLRAE